MSLLTAYREPIALVQPESRITNEGLFRKSTRSESKLKLGSNGVRKTDPSGSFNPEGIGTGNPTAM